MIDDPVLDMKPRRWYTGPIGAWSKLLIQLGKSRRVDNAPLGTIPCLIPLKSEKLGLQKGGSTKAASEGADQLCFVLEAPAR